MLTLWKPFNNPSRFNDFFENDFFRVGEAGRSREWLPSVDVKEEENSFIVTAELPGVSSKDVDVEVHEGVLSIKGEKKFEDEEKKDGYHRIERCYGSFTRSFRLPSRVDAGKIEAKYKDGVLTISIPKKEVVKPRKVSIKS
ncbi:MAG: Hsp20/alpha crystallin family protein [Pseudomonadota bacterium]